MLEANKQERVINFKHIFMKQYGNEAKAVSNNFLINPITQKVADVRHFQMFLYDNRLLINWLSIPYNLLYNTIQLTQLLNHLIIYIYNLFQFWPKAMIQERNWQWTKYIWMYIRDRHRNEPRVINDTTLLLTPRTAHERAVGSMATDQRNDCCASYEIPKHKDRKGKRQRRTHLANAPALR